jgi:hypothetical protein
MASNSDLSQCGNKTLAKRNVYHCPRPRVAVRVYEVDPLTANQVIPKVSPSLDGGSFGKPVLHVQGLCWGIGK